MSEQLPFESVYRHGFARVAACTIPVAIADPARNAAAVVAAAREAHDEGAAVAVFPELCLTGYAIDDLVMQDVVLDAVVAAVERIVEASPVKHMGSVEQAEPAESPTYSAEQFAKNLPAWRSAIAAGKATADAVIAKARTKGTLTQEQMDAIRAQSQSLIAQSNGEIEAGQRQIVQSLQLGRIGIALVALGGLLAFYLYLRQTIALQQAGARQQQALEQERLHLEDLVHERTASLAELATHLQKVREDERSHLARELHDELGALLTAAKLDVARLKSKVDPGLQDMHERIRHLTDTLNSGIALKRRIVEDLHPSSLYHLGLRASLEILAKEFADRSGIVVDTGVEDVALDAAAQLTVYRLVQEALTNIGKYAEATEVSVTVRSYPGHAEVDVKDNGKGFDTTNLKPSTHGLAGMRHRVEAAGGRLSVRSQPGQGTQVSASLPKQR